MKKRFLTGVVIVLLTIGVFALRFVSSYFFDAYLLAIMMVSTYEVANSFKNKKKFANYFVVLSYPLLAYILLIVAISVKMDILLYYAILLSFMLIMFVVSLVVNLAMKDKMNREMIEVEYVGTYKKYALKKSMIDLFVMFYPAFVLFQMLILNHLSNWTNFAGLSDKKIELFLFVLIFVTTIITDTGAYLVGSSLRGKKLCPKISPNKTISGAVGGVILSITFSCLLFLLLQVVGFQSVIETYNLTIWHFLTYGLFASIFTQIGDILASLLKRKNEVKDFGKILVGHGGFMDRVDGLCLNAVITLILGIIIFA